MTDTSNPPIYVAFTVLAGQGDMVKQAMTKGGLFQQIGYADYVTATRQAENAKLDMAATGAKVEPLAFISRAYPDRHFQNQGWVGLVILGDNAPGVVEYAAVVGNSDVAFTRSKGKAYQQLALR